MIVRGGKAKRADTPNEPAQGRVGVRVTLNDGGGWCADTPATPTGDPPWSANTHKRAEFVGQPSTPAPASCPALP